MIKPCFAYWGRPLNWWGNIREYFNWLHQFFLRGANGWCYADVWGLCDYLVDILIPALKELKEIEHGYPMIDSSLNEEDAIALWNSKLDLMIAGFEAAKRILKEDYPIKGYIKEYRKDERIFKVGMKEFTKHFFHLWD